VVTGVEGELRAGKQRHDEKCELGAAQFWKSVPDYLISIIKEEPLSW
jgi:hypothetical protein